MQTKTPGIALSYVVYLDLTITYELSPGEKQVCYNLNAPDVRAFVWFFTPPSVVKRKWWNWQTHHLEGVAPKRRGGSNPPFRTI